MEYNLMNSMHTVESKTTKIMNLLIPRYKNNTLDNMPNIYIAEIKQHVVYYKNESTKIFTTHDI